MHPPGIFLTFLILTYRRPEKVVRLLNLFLDERWHQLAHLKFEIVVADDHGEDGTWKAISPLIDRLAKQGWLVRYVYRKSNLRGDRNMYYGYTRDSSGKYVWFLCDDDVIDVGEAIAYLEAVNQTNPLISICGFSQGSHNQYGNSLGSEIRLVSDFPEAVDYMIQFPKTTAFLLRRCPEIDLDNVFERWDRTLFSWVGISIYLLARNKGAGLLLYPSIVAKADDDYSVLRYSYRNFNKLYGVAKDSIELSDMSFDVIKPHLGNLAMDDEISSCLNGLKAHYSWRTPTKYTPEVLKEEWTYMKHNWPAVMCSRHRMIASLKLAVYFIGSHAINC